MEDKAKSTLDEVILHAQALAANEEGSPNHEGNTSHAKAQETLETNQGKPTEVETEAKKGRGRPPKKAEPDNPANIAAEDTTNAGIKPKKRFWEDEDGLGNNNNEPDLNELLKQKEQQIADYEAKLKRFNKPVLEQLADAMESPDFDTEKFFESYKPKDFKDLSLEELWKMKKKTSSNVDYSDDELDELWQAEYEEVSGSNAKQKQMKDRLISELKPKIDLGKEPEYISSLKKTVAEQREARQNNEAAFNQMIDGLMNYVDTLDGAEVYEGLNVSKDDIEQVKSAFKPGYYLNQDGSPNIKKMGNDRLKAQMFDKLIGHLEEIAKIQAKKEVYRPSLNSINPDNGTVETEDVAGQIVNAVIQNKELLKRK